MKTATRRVWGAAALLALVFLLTACTSTPLPPFFVARGSVRQSAQPANPTPVATAVAQAPAAQPEPVLTPTEAPTVAPTEAPTEAPTDTPTVEPTATATSAPPTATATRAAPTATTAPTRAAATATTRPTRAAAPATPIRVQPTPTAEFPKTIAITEAQIEELAASGQVPGLTIDGLDVTFGDDTMTVFFSSLRYGFISLRDVTVEGHFEVSNGAATFVADRITPRNLATTQIPGFVNQALGQQFSQWYVESLSIEPGTLTATVRPR